MAWLKVDDRLHDHRKSRKAGKAAMGVWVLAGSWSAATGTDGFIPADVLPRWGSRGDAARLVSAGLWIASEHEGEKGWTFHDWQFFNPPAVVTEAKRVKEHEAGVMGNHRRWHVARGITDDSCEHCYRVPDSPPDRVPDDDRIRDPIGSSSLVPEPVPIPLSPNGEKLPATAVAVPVRSDVERLCEHLARRVCEDGSKRPTITQKWRDAARLLIDKDGRSEQQVHNAIDWSQDHHFWRSNIMSMPTLRSQYDRLRKVADYERSKPGNDNAGIIQRAAQRMGITEGTP